MKQASFSHRSVWVWNGLVPWRLAGRDLALALLLRQQPLSLPKLCSRLSANGPAADSKALIKSLARLKSHGVVEERGGVYVCTCDKLSSFNNEYTAGQLLDLVGLTQSAVGGKTFYTSTPPMGTSSVNGSFT